MKSIIHARIADSVLQDDNWGYIELTVVDGLITGVREVEPGCYGWDYGPAAGWDLEQLLKWVKYDSTGTHPEEYHELRVPGGSFLSISIDSMDRLKELLEVAACES